MPVYRLLHGRLAFAFNPRLRSGNGREGDSVEKKQRCIAVSAEFRTFRTISETVRV